MNSFFKFGFLFVFFACIAISKPISPDEAKTALETFVSLRYPAANQAEKRTVTSVGASYLSISKIEPLIDSGKTIGFVSELQPNGFVLMRADSLCPPIKLYYNKGSFSDLPPDFIDIMKWELKQELQNLNEILTNNLTLKTHFEENWAALLNPTVNSNKFVDYGDVITSAGPLLTTTWNQNSPYNYYAPAAAGGPGERAYAGCVACAMAQIMHYHSSPTAIASDYTYTDSSGSCQGTHSASDAGLGNYQWSSMPNSISDSSSTAQKQAIGQLMYHAAVTVQMDFEAGSSGTYSEYVPNALRTYFNYSCSDLTSRSGYSDSQWYTKLDTDINNSCPVFYSFRDEANRGHAVVCDGTRNSNEIHINFGWGGIDNAWYNLNSINSAHGNWDYNHRAIFEISNSGSGGVPPAPTGLSASDGTYSDKIALSWNASSGATKYSVYANTTDNSSTASLLGEVTGTSANVTGITPGQTYYYWVKAGNDNGWSDFSASDSGYASSGGGGDGDLTIYKLKGKINRKVNPCIGNDMLIASIPTTLTDLSFLKDCPNISGFLTFNSGAGDITGSAGAFKSMNRKGTRVSLKYKSTVSKYSVSTKLKLKNNILYIFRKMKNGSASDTKFNISNTDANWSTRDVSIKLNLSYGSTSIQGTGIKTINYKTKADKKTVIK